MKRALIIVGICGLIALPTTFGADLEKTTRLPSSQVSVSLTTQTNELQDTLEKATKELMTQLSGTMDKIQKLYDSKVKSLVETDVFKAVACMNMMDESSASVDVESLMSEYQKGILEQYVELSADIKRVSVGLSSDDFRIQSDIENFKQNYLTQLASVESNYEQTYAQLKADFERYYVANDTLLYDVADKIQKIDSLNVSYKTLIAAHDALYQVLDERTQILPILDSPRQSILAIFKGDLDDIIRKYQSKNPEIDYDKVYTKKDELITDFAQELEGFLSILFGSEYPVKKYLTQVDLTQEFIETYLIDGKYQCSQMIASPINRERTYLKMSADVEALIPGFTKAQNRVYSWRDDQITKMEPLIDQVFAIYYNRIMNAEKKTFNSFITQLIAEAYYANQSSPAQN